MEDLELNYTQAVEEEEIMRVAVRRPHLDPVRASAAAVTSRLIDLIADLPTMPQGKENIFPIDVDDFFHVIAQVVALELKAERAVEDVPVYEDYPSTDVKDECITVKLIKREPGTFGQNAPFKDPRQYRPVLRSTKPDPNYNGYLIVTLSQWFDNLVEITCWARTHKQANHRAAWLEDLMLRRYWFFLHAGIDKLAYLGRTEDVTFQQANFLIFGRPLRFFVRTEKRFSISEKMLEDLILKVRISDS